MERLPMERALSTDVVMDIVLRHLRVEDLLSCRKVSKFWNKAATAVLRRRSTMVRNISKTKTLTEFGQCLKQSSDFPFAGLKFGEPWKLRTVGAMKFLRNYGARFTSLYFGTWSDMRLKDIAPFIHHLPRLSSLEVYWSDSLPPPPPAESSDSDSGQEDGRMLNLQSLRTFRIFCSRLNEDVLRGVCTAASPSLRIECLWTSYRTLRALKSAGKLQAVAVMKVIKDQNQQEDKLRVDELLSTETPALTKLDFNPGGCISRQGLMKLLISSQRTLKELHLVGICLSEFSSECPVLAKLTSLRVSIQESCEYLFQGNHGHKFPLLTELKLNTGSEIRISDGLFIVPTVTRIILEGYAEKDAMKELAQAFPNVHTIGLDYSFYSELEEETFKTDDGESVPSEIWSVREFKQLEKLRIREYLVRPSYENYHNMDSFLTGIPFSIRQNIKNQKPELMVNLIKSPPVQSFSEVLRVRPSLLQLKNLKELVICVKLEDGLEELPEEPPFMSMISVWFALGMMPNLEAKFVYESMEVDEETEAEATMLKAAFKHVQPHVKLEPFFY